MNRNYLISIIIFSFVLEKAAAQQQTTYFMHALPQSVHLNPANKFDYAFGLSLFSLENQTNHNGFSYKDIFKKEGKKLRINGEDLISKLRNNNQIISNINFDGGLYMHFNNLQVSLLFKENIRMSFDYPKNLLDLIANGNQALLDESLLIAPEFSLLHIREINLNLGYSFLDEKLRIGVNLKPVFKIGAAITDNLNLNFSTLNQSNYPIEASTNGLIRTAGLTNIIITKDGKFDQLADREDITSNYLSNFSEMNFLLDIGANYLLTDKFSLGASILNIGSNINWNNNLKNYKLGDKKRTTFSFDGIDIINEEDPNTDALLDSLDALFRLVEAENQAEKFILNPPISFSVNGSYEIIKNLTANALFFGQIYRKNFYPSFSLNLNKEFGKILSLSLTYSANHFKFFNLGGGISLNLVPLQIFMISDNILSSWSDYKNVIGNFSNSTENTANLVGGSVAFINSFSLRLGVSIVVGRKSKKNKK